MLPRVGAPDWEYIGAKCLKFRPFRPENCGPDDIEDPWFDPDQYEDAKAICNGTYDQKICPARDTCLKFASINNEASGVWGGMDEFERQALRRRMKHKYRTRPDRAPSWEYTWQHREKTAPNTGEE